MSLQKPVSRRTFLKSTVAAAGAAAGLVSAARPALADGDYIIGWSQWGLPLVVHALGKGPIKLFLMGAQHGEPEANTRQLVHLIRDRLMARNGVDSNRNWAAPDWQPDTYDSLGRFRYGLGGGAPFSEQETTALAHWLWQTWPQYFINYHSSGGFMQGSGGQGLGAELSDLYAAASGYWRPADPDRPLGYRVTGDLNSWARSVGMAGCLIELTSDWEPEFDRNFEGVRAVLERLAAEPLP